LRTMSEILTPAVKKAMQNVSQKNNTPSPHRPHPLCNRRLAAFRHSGNGDGPEEDQLFEIIVRHSSDAIVVTDDQGLVRYANPAAAKLFGRRVEKLLGRPLGLPTGGERNEVDIIRPEGDLVVAEMLTSRIPWGKKQARLAMLRDITEWRETLSRLDHLAHFDPLTELPNRSELQRQLRKALSRASRRNAQVAVLFLDLDGFKVVNDTLGHTTGDLLLREVAVRLNASVRAGDLLARIGGDEFVLVLENITCTNDAAHVAEKLIKALEAPFQLDDTTLHLSASVGIALCPQDGVHAGRLVQTADHAMYRAKAAGRGTYAFSWDPHD